MVDPLGLASEDDMAAAAVDPVASDALSSDALHLASVLSEPVRRGAAAHNRSYRTSLWLSVGCAAGCAAGALFGSVATAAALAAGCALFAARCAIDAREAARLDAEARRCASLCSASASCAERVGDETEWRARCAATVGRLGAGGGTAR